MANPRLPVAKAAVTGATSKNPQRHRDRKEPSGRPLGEATAFLDDHGKQAWEGFRRELPWLMECDRALVEIAAKLRGLVISGADVGEGKLKLLQTILGRLGASPTDRTKVALPETDDHDDLLD